MALPIDYGTSIAWAPDLRHVRKALLGLLPKEQAKEGEVAMAEEKNEEEERRGPLAGRVAPLQAPEPVQGGPMWPGLFSGQGAREEGRELPTSEKDRGKAPTVEPPPPETDKEMCAMAPGGGE